MEEAVCYVVGAGDFYPRGLLPGAGDLLIAADGGYAALAGVGMEPHLVLGDFDSLAEVPDRADLMRLPREKDDTDMLFALRVGAERGYRSFRIYGGTGGRVDHTLANLQCLKWLSRRGLAGALHGDGWVARAVTDGTLDFGAECRGYVSVFCQGDRAEGVWLRGLKYPLENAVLTDDFPLGVSNEFTGAPASVTVEKGTVLVVWYQGADEGE